MKRRILAAVAVTSLLLGCGGGGVVPNGPHAIDPATLNAIVAGASARAHVDKALVAAMIRAESHGDPSAISRAGAQGLMQLMPSTSLQYGVMNPFDPIANVDGGARYMHDLLKRYRGNVKLALAAYNAGPATVDALHGIPPFAETRAYVARVVADAAH